jgi:hypothetical protein
LGGGSDISLQIRDAAGNLGNTKTQAYTLDITAPTVSLTTAILPSASSVYVRSNELGQLYLVNSSLSVASLNHITSAADNLWNSASVSTANADTALSLGGLIDGNYRLYASDTAGNLSVVSSNSMTVDSAAPPSITSMALSADTAANGTSNTDFVQRVANDMPAQHRRFGIVKGTAKSFADGRSRGRDNDGFLYMHAIFLTQNKDG